MPKVPNIIGSTFTISIIFLKLSKVVDIVNNFVIPFFLDLSIMLCKLLNKEY